MNTAFMSHLTDNKDNIATAIAMSVPHRKRGALEAINSCIGRSPEEINRLREEAFEKLQAEERSGRRVGNYQICRGYFDAVRWIEGHVA